MIALWTTSVIAFAVLKLSGVQHLGAGLGVSGCLGLEAECIV